jgi:hypothetical protein
VKCYRDGCPSGGLSHLRKGTLVLYQSDHRVLGHLPSFYLLAWFLLWSASICLISLCCRLISSSLTLSTQPLSILEQVLAQLLLLYEMERYVSQPSLFDCGIIGLLHGLPSSKRGNGEKVTDAQISYPPKNANLACYCNGEILRI